MEYGRLPRRLSGTGRHGEVVIRCEREENATGGALNFDGFRAPAPGEANGMGTAAGSEVDGFAVALPFGGGSQPVRNVSLGKGPKQFRLGAPAGRYRLLVNVKSSGPFRQRGRFDVRRL